MQTYTQHKLTFEQFLEQYPEDGFYGLIDGKIVEVRPTINHDDVANFMLFGFNAEGKYQRTQFRGSERIVPRIFPELQLTAEQILTA